MFPFPDRGKEGRRWIRSYRAHYTTLHHTATHCTTLRHAATHCNSLQPTHHTATHCTTPHITAPHYTTPRLAAPRRNTPHLPAPQCLSLRQTTTCYTTLRLHHTSTQIKLECATLQHTATHCNILQHTATHPHASTRHHIYAATTLCVNFA